ncbi:MAG: diaminopimelate epimerase [Chloroflexi bacterium]|nr:diaminopimelate epimerase [Chloroflexota bacterium]
MSFTKMHGLGNDFIMVQAVQEAEANRPGSNWSFPRQQGECGKDWSDEQWRDLAIKVCDRHFGVGSDGLIAILPSLGGVADFRMRMFNPDGSEAQMCGNGIRCFSRYVFERGLTKSTKPAIETLAGVKQVDLSVAAGKVVAVRVNMGTPAFDAARIPAKSETPTVKDHPLSVGGKVYSVSCVSMGNPHTITFLSEAEVNILDLPALGPLFEHHRMFPERTNTEFCAVLDEKTVRMRVWERGAGETLACGTGACASAVAAIDHGLVGNQVEMVLDGGRLTVEWQGEGHPVLMTGPAEYICDGEYYYGD